jgi:hypothetical protein
LYTIVDVELLLLPAGLSAIICPLAKAEKFVLGTGHALSERELGIVSSK